MPEHDSDRILAAILKATLAGPDIRVWGQVARLCAESAVQSADRQDAAHAALLAAAAVVYAQDTPETGDSLDQAVNLAVSRAAALRPGDEPPPPEAEDELLLLAEIWIDEALKR